MRITIAQEVPEIEVIPRKQFEKQFYFPQKPVVIKGLFANDPADGKWGLNFFKKQMGSLPVGIFDATLESVDRAYKKPHYQMSFADYLQEIQQGPTKKRLFLFNAFKHNPSLLDDFRFPEICGGFIRSFPFMFFGGEGSVTRAHQDVDMSCIFLTQFEGRKRVVLFDPIHSKLLYRLPFNVHTPVDIDNPDFDKYPGLQFVQGLETTLTYGDTLFIPSGWWHYIQYLDSGFSMSLRCLSPHKKDWIMGAWKVGVVSTLDDWLRKSIGKKKWYQYKEDRAIRLAQEEIDRIERERVLA